MCVPILRSICTELTNLDNMQNSHVLFDVTWRKNGTSYVMGATIPLIGISIENILTPTRSLYGFRFKRYGSYNGFCDFGDLDILPMFYFSSHTLGMKSPREVS